MLRYLTAGESHGKAQLAILEGLPAGLKLDAGKINRELKRRTRVAGLFPNEDSLLRLITALLNERSDEWQTNKVYLTMENHPQPSV